MGEVYDAGVWLLVASVETLDAEGHDRWWSGGGLDYGIASVRACGRWQSHALREIGATLL